MTMTDTARKIQALRRKAVLSRQEMARRLNVEYPYYLEVEKGTIPPGDEVVRAIAATFGVSESEITGEARPEHRGVADVQSGTLRRLVLRQKALLELLVEKGMIQEAEFEEAYRIAGKGK